MSVAVTTLPPVHAAVTTLTTQILQQLAKASADLLAVHTTMLEGTNADQVSYPPNWTVVNQCTSHLRGLEAARIALQEEELLTATSPKDYFSAIHLLGAISTTLRLNALHDASEQVRRLSMALAGEIETAQGGPVDYSTGGGWSSDDKRPAPQ